MLLKNISMYYPVSLTNLEKKAKTPNIPPCFVAFFVTKENVLFLFQLLAMYKLLKKYAL